MGIFGAKWSDVLGAVGSGLRDVGSALDGQEGGYLDRYQAQQRADREAVANKTAQAKAYDDFNASLGALGQAGGGHTGGDQTGGGQTGTGQAGGDQAGGGQAGGEMTSLSPWLRAQQAGIDISGLERIWEAQQPKPHLYQGVNFGNGYYGSFDPASNEIHMLRRPDPVPRPPQVVTGKDGIYTVDPVTGATHKVSSWAAFAPVRPRVSAAKTGTAKAGTTEAVAPKAATKDHS